LLAQGDRSHDYYSQPPPASFPPAQPAPPRAIATAPAPPPALRRVAPAINPVLFWNDTAMQLDALDHSIDANDARAPGPCAAARAFGLVHIVMADAAAAVYPGEFEPHCVHGAQYPDNEYADVFIGGAAARILEHIYSTPAHTHLIGAQRQRFLKFFGSRALEAWNGGVAFGGNEQFTSQWRWDWIRPAVKDSATRGQNVRYGEHDVDPFNPDQKFYGVGWGRMPPLLPGLPIERFMAGPPPPLDSPEFRRDWDEVRQLGGVRTQGPTDEQVKIGLFWAYCGVRLIGTPARLYNQVMTQIIAADGLSVPETARTLALCNLALADAGIICWEGKYRYQFWRPVIGITHDRLRPDRDWRPFGSPRTNPWQFALGGDARRLTALSMLGGGEANGLGERTGNTLPYHRAAFTPNFPSYPSGHACFGSACFTVLMRVRAERVAGRDDPGRIDHAGPFVSDEVNGLSIDNFRNVARPFVPRAYSHIRQMIEDNSKSRVHLGVHWDFDCRAGEASGTRLAEAVYNSAYRRLR
jgi:membrane-associated phospholipid phosphatase